MAVGDDERRAVVRLRFQERLQCVLVLRPHRDGRDVDVAVSHRHQAEIFLSARVCRRRRTSRPPRAGLIWNIARRCSNKLRCRAVAPSRCDRSPARDRVRRNRCRSPSRRHRQSRRSCARGYRRARADVSASGSSSDSSFRFRFRDALALFADVGFIALARIQDFGGQRSPDLRRELLEQFAGKLLLFIERNAETETELGVVFKQANSHQAGPRPFRFFVYGVVGRLPP